MTKLTTTLAMAAAVLAAGFLAPPARADKRTSQPGALHVYGNDEAKWFSADGIKRAEAVLSGTRFDHGMALTIDLYAKMPDGKVVPPRGPERDKFFHAMAAERATADKAKGIYVLVSTAPEAGFVEVLADRQTRDRGFTNENERHLREILVKGFGAATKASGDEVFKLRDQALNEAAEFVVNDLKGTSVSTSSVSATTGKTADTVKEKTGRSIGGWICLGLCVLLGVWLVIGLIRALTGGGGGGGGYGPGGGGGGGFGSSLLGGLFGAMAGMWLYNSMFGSGGMFGGSDAYAGDAGAGGGGDTGAGDFGGDTGAGGDYGDGGGDYGGGGGDFGGGDYGGGGDFGGGDFGGGGDF